ncbi:MAG TPA: PQQ-dependent sugar dehydrogenase [Acidimicrobiales bacterium]|nr:PQQ-dependent sugar dehydrogenase [Acidimicrobiales bacterium]
MAVSIAGCSDDAPAATVGEPSSTTAAATTTSPGTGSGTATTAAPATTLAPTTTTRPVVPAPAPGGDVRVRLQRVATAQAPLVLATRTGTRALYIAERAGRVRVLDPSTGALSDTIIDISSDVSSGGERGLLGMTFSPDGTRLYLSYTNRDGDSRVDEFVAQGDNIDKGSRRNLFAIDQPAPNHNGGTIIFGPDGMLWYGLGDGGGGGDQYRNAQNVNTLLGSILRVDVSSRSAGQYGIPGDNPFANGGGKPEIWLYGVRNPWRFSFDRLLGDLWIGDVGQNAYEEIDVLPAPDRGRGANLQWPLREGFRRYSGDAPAGSTPPIFDYDRSNGECSVTGGFVYRGRAIPFLQGAYVFADYCEGTLRALFTGAGGKVESRSLGANAGSAQLGSFGEDADGELYVLALGGSISRIVAA